MTKSKDSALTPSDKSPDDDPWWDNWWAEHAPEVIERGFHDMTVQSLLSIEFLKDEERGVEAALVFLLEQLRLAKSPELEGVVTVSDIIADMLDPDKPGQWKLELKRNVPGSPSLHHGMFYYSVASRYFEQLNALKEEGARRPPKKQEEDCSNWRATLITTSAGRYGGLVNAVGNLNHRPNGLETFKAI